MNRAMEAATLLTSVGFCGLVCAICRRSDDGCPGCRAGGGNPYCVQRRCCEVRQLEGCWECADFPCNQGYFGVGEWQGLCVACVQAIRQYGIDEYVRRARARLGEMVSYEDFICKDARQVQQQML